MSKAMHYLLFLLRNAALISKEFPPLYNISLRTTHHTSGHLSQTSPAVV